MTDLELKKLYPLFTEKELLDEILAHGIEKAVKEGELIIRNGEYIKALPLIISGGIKVVRLDESGKELFLYYLKQGKTCAMSITCCLQSQASMVQAKAIEDTTLLMIPLAKSEEWMGKFKSWRRFIIESYSTRLDELLNTLDEVAFKQLDERLLIYLEEKSKTIDALSFEITHGEIAKDLNASREAISRLLKKMEKEGMLELSRNKITLINVS